MIGSLTSMLTVFHLVVKIGSGNAGKWILTSIELGAKMNWSSDAGIVNLEQAFLKDRSNRSFYPRVSNLKQYLSPFSSGDKSCIVIIDNYQFVDLTSVGTPLILRTPMLLVAQLENENAKFKTRLGASSLRNFSLPENTTVSDCPLSTFLGGVDMSIERDTSWDLCIRLNHTTYITNIKTPNCQLHIGLYPKQTTPYRIGRNSPKLFKIPLKKSGKHSMLIPPSVPLLNCLILSKEADFDTYWDTNWIQTVAQNSFIEFHDSSWFPYTYDVFVILLVATIHERVHAVKFLNGFIAEAHVLQICHTCNSSLQKSSFGTVVRYPINKWNDTVTNAELLISTAFPREGEELVWEISPRNEENINLLHALLQHLNPCLPISSRQDLWKEITTPALLINRVGAAHAQVWKSVLRNFTILLGIFSKIKFNCSLGLRQSKGMHLFQIDISKQAYVQPYSLPYPFYIQDKLSSLRFIACGSISISAIPFQELTNVYDTRIWFLILLSAVAIPATIRIVSKNAPYFTGVVSIVRILLEQGGPFSNAVTNMKRLWFITGTTLLVGIILSNAYKNDNIYKMITPRKPIPFKYLRELLSHNFSFYTRSISIGPFRLGDLRHDDITWETDYIAYTYQLNLFQVSKYSHHNINNNRSTLITDVVNRTKPHPEWLPGFIKMGTDDYVKTGRGDMLHSPIFMWERMRLYSNFLPEEKKILLRSLTDCQRTALILPDYACWEYLQSAKKGSGWTSRLSLGREHYSDIDWMFTFRGIISPHVIRRFMGIHQSGIWQWWVELLRRRYDVDAPNAEPVKPANMQGNISLIFMLWAGGLGCTHICFLLEFFGGKLFNWIKAVVTFIMARVPVHFEKFFKV